MSKKGKVKLISIGGIIIALVLLVLSFLLNIRSEFVQYLHIEYPEQSFKVGFTKVDILYDKYYSRVICLSDGTDFGISKGFKTKNIYNDYIQSRSQTQYNSKIKSIFEGSDIQKYIVEVTGSGKIPFESNAPYEQINIFLVSNTDQGAVAKKSLDILRDKGIYAERIIFTYEKDKNVYELHVPSNDYNLTEKEIQSQIRKIK